MHHSFKAGCKESYNVENKIIEYSINEAGMRERPLNEIAKDRILLMGDSNVEGHGINFPHTISQTLERLLASPKGPSILNGGLRFSGPLLERLRIHALVEKLHPQKILWFFSESDSVDDRLFEGLATKRDAIGLPIEFSTEDFDRSRLNFPPWIERFFSEKTLHFFRVFKYSRVVGSISQRIDPGNIGSCRAISETKKFLEQRKISLSFVILPLGPNQKEKSFAESFQNIVNCLPKDVPLLDLRISLPMDDSRYLRGDTHPSEKGTEFIAEQILKNHLLP
jgi:hypothetical protein